MLISKEQLEATASRWKARELHRQRNQRLIECGRPLEADTAERVDRFLKRRGLPSAASGREAFAMPDSFREDFALERVLGTSDLMGVAFLECGVRAARTVGRISVGRDGGTPSGYGTGFLVSPRLLLTNHHVLPSKEIASRSSVEFDYEVDGSGVEVSSRIFELDPDRFFLNDVGLDFALVAVREQGTGGALVRDYGWNQLFESQGKSVVSQFLNIIQHPGGERKQLALRENQLIDIEENFLTYKTDTAQGSSGAPVYNDRWEVVAIHHCGVAARNPAGQVLATDDRVWREEMGEHRIKWVGNEGVRISRIIGHVRGKLDKPEHRSLFAESLASGPSSRTFTSLAGAPIRTSTVGAPEGNGHAKATSAYTSAISADGVATWTIPITLSVQLGERTTVLAAPPRVDDGDRPPSPPRAPDTDPKDSAESILAAAEAEIGARTDVVSVRLGYVFENGWITREPAIVVAVRARRTPTALREAAVDPLPRRFRGLRVEVTEPTVRELLELAGHPGPARVGASEVLGEEITYTPPARANLSPVRKKMRVVAHTSPDTGWSQLRAFLRGAREKLVVGMYDFGARHVLDEVLALRTRNAKAKLTLVMQRGESVGEGTKANDLADQEVVDALRGKYKKSFRNAWVRKGAVNGWIASSYHIKVAVRDDKAFWLSSGNWQSSNQPEGDPLGDGDLKWLRDYNREWHAIVDNEELAKTFRDHILHDFENNEIEGAELLEAAPAAFPGILVPDAAEAVTSRKYFAPFDQNRVFTVTPILTPDNFHAQVLELVQSAEEELLIQNQTFNAPRDGHAKLRELLEAVLERKAAGVTVKIVFRVLRASDARANLEKLVDFGFDADDIKLQKNCHTKGVIVDRRRVLLGSQNWSNDGVSVNRDASLLFDDAALAKYFGEIFDHDWANLAKRSIGREVGGSEIALAPPPDRPGMRWVGWKELVELM